MQEMNKSIVKNYLSDQFERLEKILHNRKITILCYFYLPSMPKRRRLIWTIVNEILFDANTADIGYDLL